MLSKKWLIILIIIIAILLILFLPFWCSTYYLPGWKPVRHCGPIFDLFKTY